MWWGSDVGWHEPPVLLGHYYCLSPLAAVIAAAADQPYPHHQPVYNKILYTVLYPTLSPFILICSAFTFTSMLPATWNLLKCPCGYQFKTRNRKKLKVYPINKKISAGHITDDDQIALHHTEAPQEMTICIIYSLYISQPKHDNGDSTQ